MSFAVTTSPQMVNMKDRPTRYGFIYGFSGIDVPLQAREFVFTNVIPQLTLGI